MWAEQASEDQAGMDLRPRRDGGWMDGESEVFCGVQPPPEADSPLAKATPGPANVLRSPLPTGNSYENCWGMEAGFTFQ